MDENMSGDDRPQSASDENAKKFKVDNGSEESTTNQPANMDQDGASTSSDSGVVRTPPDGEAVAEATGEPMEEGRNEEQRGRTEDEDSLLHPDDDLSYHNSDSWTDASMNQDSDSEMDEDIAMVLKKEKPKHNWFILPEVMNRELGYNTRKQNPEYFMRRCYGSLRNVQRLELMYKMEEHAGCVNSLNFHPDGTLLASGSDDLKVVIWDWKLGKSLLKIVTKHRRNVFQSKFMNMTGDLHIATSSRDGHVLHLTVARQEGLRSTRKMGSHRGPCHKLAVLKDHPQIVLSAGEDGVVLRHDVRVVRSDNLVKVRENDRDIALYSINVHPTKSNEFCVCGREETVRIYDTRKGRTPVSVFYPFPKSGSKSFNHVTCAVYNYNGSEILASYNDADIYLFDVNAPPGQYIHSYMGHRNGVTIKGVNFFGPKSEYIVSGSDCGHVYFWEKNSEAIVNFLLADDNGVVNCLEPHPQLPFICTSGLDWDIKLWVPSNENDPEMKGLEETVKKNRKARTEFNDDTDFAFDETQILWSLWHRLNSMDHRLLRRTGYAPNPLHLIFASSGSSSSTASSQPSSSSGSSDNDDLDAYANRALDTDD